MPADRVSRRSRIFTPTLGVMLTLACCGLILVSVFFPYRKPPDKMTSYLRDLPHYTRVQPIVLAAVTVSSRTNENAIWLVRVSDHNPVDYYKLATVHLDNESAEAGPSPSNQAPFYLVPCAMVSQQLCVVEQVRKGLDKQELSLHRWTIDWSSGSEPLIRSDTQIIIIPARAQLTGVISHALYYADNTGSYRLDLSSDTSAQMSANPSDIQCSSPRLSPKGKFLTNMCLTRIDVSRPASPYIPTGQHLRLLNLDNSTLRILTPQNGHTYHFVGLGSFAYGIAPPVSPQYAWSPDETQIAFVTALEPPRLINPAEQSPGNYEDSGAIYSFSLQDGSLQKLTSTYGWNPSLSWSPDKRFIAYALGNDLNIVSLAGEQRTIRKYDQATDYIDDIRWSSDGSYIAVKHTGGIEVIRTSDYASQMVDLPGKTSEIDWMTP